MPTPPTNSATTQPSPARALAARLTALSRLLGMFCQAPPAWLSSGPGAGKAQTTKTPQLGALPCTTYRVLVQAWRKALRWTPGLDHTLAVMLASVASTKLVGDQLWIKVIGVAGSGKSRLADALATNTQFVIGRSTIRGFHSGYHTDGTDNSLLPLVMGRTLVTKDGDTLLQSPNLRQILSEARDLYDGTARTHYRNATGREYSGIRMTWILCGTSSLRAIDCSELGERFLDCVLMEKIDPDEEDPIVWRAANQSLRNVLIEADGKPESHYAPSMANAYQLTAGYVQYLRENAVQLLRKIEVSRGALVRCTHLAKFIGRMRARPSTIQKESAQRELPTRLVDQLVRLATCLAIVLNRKQVDRYVMGRVRRVALDTSRGPVLELTRYLATNGDGATTVQSAAMHTGLSDVDTRTLLRFLHRIDVLQPFTVHQANGRTVRRVYWRLTDDMASLYRAVMQTK